MPTGSPTTKNPTTKPTTKPTTNPTANQTTNPTANPTATPTVKPTANPTAKTTTPVENDSPHPYPYPTIRFTQWTELSTDEKIIAESLDYTRYLWDNLEIAAIESYPFDHLQSSEQQSITNLGLDEDMWDCYINHYYGYYWNEMEDAGVSKYYEVLGWNKSNWEEGGDEPDAEDKYWDELTSEEQTAAMKLCYSGNAWDWISLEDW